MKLHGVGADLVDDSRKRVTKSPERISIIFTGSP